MYKAVILTKKKNRNFRFPKETKIRSRFIKGEKRGLNRKEV